MFSNKPDEFYAQQLDQYPEATLQKQYRYGPVTTIGLSGQYPRVPAVPAMLRVRMFAWVAGLVHASSVLHKWCGPPPTQAAKTSH
jgi:hypothetical protein